MSGKHDQPPTQPNPNMSTGSGSGYGGDGKQPPVVGQGMEDQGGPDDEKSPAQRLGAKLRQARLRLNLTQREVAATHFSAAYLSAVERGQMRPSLGALEALAERLGVPLEKLLGTSSSRTPDSQADPSPEKEDEIAETKDDAYWRQIAQALGDSALGPESAESSDGGDDGQDHNDEEDN